MGDEWNGAERRRQPEVCPMHGVIFESIDKKFTDIDRTMNEIANRQIEYIKSQAKLEYAISNGMRTDVMVIRERLDTFCAGMDKELSKINGRLDTFCDGINKELDGIKGRLTILEAFKWFRDIANKFRETVIWNILKFAIAGGLIVSLIYFGEKIKNWMVG